MLNIARLLPNEKKFFRLLEQLSTQARQSAQHLKTFVESKDARQRAGAAAAIAQGKANAKTTAAEITRELCLTFITPFDREDIQNFSSDLYKISKTIEKIREYMEMHKISDLSGLTGQVDLIVQESEAMESMVQALIKGGRPEQIMEKAALLDDLENKGDAVLSALLVNLISNTQDVRKLILEKDIYDMLERVIDRYRDAANVALQIALKHT